MIGDKTNSIFYALPNGTITFGKKNKGIVHQNLVIGADKVKSATIKKSIQDACNYITVVRESEDGETSEQTCVVTVVPELNIERYSRTTAEPQNLLFEAQRQANETLEKYLQVSIDYAGFADSAGKVWEINNGVSLSDNTDSGIRTGVYVVEGVEFNNSRNEGQVATINLSLPAIY
jgi:prophage tail gpP-like protein